MTTGSRSLIDHFLVTENIQGFVNDFQVHESMNNSSDHIPIILNFDIKCEYFKLKERTFQPKIAWYKVNVNDDAKYKKCLDEELSKIN